jgi:uncharacterized protein YceK
MKMIRIFLLLAILASAFGCATIGREDIRMISGYEKWYYPATQEDVRAIIVPCDSMLFNGFEKPLYLVDLPFSLVFDTLLWPIDFVDGNFGRPQVRPKNKKQSNQSSQVTSLRADPER